LIIPDAGEIVKPVKSVEEYISVAPSATQPRLREIRAAIQEVAPDVDESISYGMPFYSYKREVGIQRRLCYFGVQKAGIAFYLRPQDLAPHAKQIAEYKSTKSALHFPADRPIPLSLIKQLVRDAIRRHEAGERAARAKKGSRSA
jgi:uncharacterized protein YdhG (YjbR/CyaY superfamily)